MPIRTDRGRAAATRAFWSWPLRSGRHMLATAVGVAVLLTAVAVASNALQGDRHAAGPAAPTSEAAAAPPLASSSSAATPGTSGYNPASSSAPAVPPSVAPATTAAGAVSAGPAGAVQTAKVFMAHWIRPPAGTSTAQWADGLRSYVMPESIAELDTVDPQNIPARKITGEPQVTTSTPTVVEANVPTDAAVIHLVIVAYTDGRWLVRTWEPA